MAKVREMNSQDVFNALDGGSLPSSVIAENSLPADWAEVTLAAGSPWQIAAPQTGGIAFDIDCSGFGAFVLEIVGTFSGNAVGLEQTIDGERWFPVNGFPAFGNAGGSNGQAAPQQNSGLGGAATLYVYPIYGMRVRAKITLGTGVMCLFGGFLAQRVDFWRAVSGPGADGATLAGYPVRMGARGVSAMPAALTNGQTADLLTSLDRRLITLADAIPEVTWSAPAAAGGITNTTAATLKAAGATGIRNYLRSLQVRNVSAVESEVVVRDGPGGTVLWRGDLPANMPAADNIRFDPPLRGSAATLMEVAVLTTGTKTYVNAQGFQGA